MNMAILKQILVIRKLPLIILAALFAMAVVLQVFITSFQQPEVDLMKTQWLKERAAETGGIYRQSRGVVYKTALADLHKFRERIYSKNNFAKFIAELYDIAGKNGLELISVMYKPTFNKDENLFQYALSLSVSGNYLQLKRFIDDLGRSNNPLVIDTVSLANQNATSATVQLQVQISTFFKAEAQ